MKTRPISIRQDIPGRLRLRVPGLNAANAHAHAVERLRGFEGMILVRVNPKCAALVLRYDPLTLSRKQLMQRLRDVFPGAFQGSCARKCAPTAACGCHAGEPATTARELKRFAAISGVVGAVFVRTTLMGATVSQALLSPLGIAVLAFSLPLARRGLRDLKRRRPSLDSFLAGGVLASVVGGQALTALEILWINSGADLLSTWIAERSRKHISEILEITSHHTFVLVNGVEVEREVSQVRPGDVVVLHTGEKISVDGVIVHGEALLDESPISGRQESIFKRTGDEVFAGAFVQEGIVRPKGRVPRRTRSTPAPSAPRGSCTSWPGARSSASACGTTCSTPPTMKVTAHPGRKTPHDQRAKAYHAALSGGARAAHAAADQKQRPA